MTTHLTPGARVVTPGGIKGTVERASARAVLVRLDTGVSRIYAASELRAVGANWNTKGPLP